MKTLFVHAKSKQKIHIPTSIISKLPDELGIFTTIQYLHQLPKVAKQLIKAGKKVKILGQTLGCRAPVNAEMPAYLFIGSGRFHPLLVAYETKKPVYLFNPGATSLSKIKKSEVEQHMKRKKINLMKFLHAENVGVLISTKVGQTDNKINKYSVKLKMKGPLELLKRKDKNYYLFAFDTLDMSEFENFNFIDCWINTACPRIEDEKKGIINITDLPSEYI